MAVDPLDIQSEPYQATGGISADGIKNQLGRPKFDRLTLLAREAVQNAWDARLSNARSVRFGIAGWDLDEDQIDFMNETVFHEVPRGGLDLSPLNDESRARTVLAIYDRGTRGLVGPTRADAVVDGEPSNFVNLLRNVGQPPVAFRGGGTYGFGKTALFLSSSIRTVLVHSRVAVSRGFQHRLIGAALGSDYAVGGRGRSAKRFTGRHWWGREAADGIVDPLIGREAQSAVNALNLPPFGDDDTGTTILVLLPDFDGRAPDDAIRHLGRAILRTFWPKMIDGPRQRGSMKFELSWNGQNVPIPRPEDTPPLDAYVKAFANLQAHRAGKPAPHQPASFFDIQSLRPVKDLGILSLYRFPPAPRVDAGNEETELGPFHESSRHTALMRGPHFVVNYVEGPPIPYDHAEYAGVFLADEGVEEAFARSEPPAHDEWSPDMLEARNDKVFVRVAVRRIHEAMQEFTGAPTITRPPGGGVALGGFSDLLGGLVAAEVGTGAGTGPIKPGRRTPIPGPGPGAGALRLRVLDTFQPEEIEARAAFKVRFELTGTAAHTVVRITASPGVLLDDGTVETDPPAGAERPTVLFWADDAGKVIGRGGSLDIDDANAGPVTVAVSIPSDASVAVDLTVSESKR